MSRTFYILPIMAVLLANTLTSCAHNTSLGTPRTYNHNYKGSWENPFKGDPNLAGVNVRQYGECPYENYRYDGKHPCAIWFFFWDGHVHDVLYEPDGKVRYEGDWKERFKPGHPYWTDVDFTHGSDPQFKHHRDPRPHTQKKGAANPS